MATGEEDSPADSDETEQDPAAMDEAELESLVEEQYDFDDFGPADMADMSPEEWEAAFDEDSWITGEELLDRLAADLSHRVARRDVFAVVERVTHDGANCLLAYSDEGYALVYPDGSIEGFGTVYRDVKPVVALCSMDSYEPLQMPDANFLLPHPEEVPEGSGALGNTMLQIVGIVQVLAGLVAIALSIYNGIFGLGDGGAGLSMIFGISGLIFLAIGILFLFTVANARLSDRFRAEEYRERLRSVGLEDGERPDFLPVEGRATELSESERSGSE